MVSKTVTRVLFVASATRCAERSMILWGELSASSDARVRKRLTRREAPAGPVSGVKARYRNQMVVHQCPSHQSRNRPRGPFVAKGFRLVPVKHPPDEGAAPFTGIPWQ